MSTPAEEIDRGNRSGKSVDRNKGFVIASCVFCSLQASLSQQRQLSSIVN